MSPASGGSQETIKLGPRAKEQPKSLSGCMECGALFAGDTSAKHWIQAMRTAGWRIREVNGRFRNVCPAHVGETDW